MGDRKLRPIERERRGGNGSARDVTEPCPGHSM